MVVQAEESELEREKNNEKRKRKKGGRGKSVKWGIFFFSSFRSNVYTYLGYHA